MVDAAQAAQILNRLAVRLEARRPEAVELDEAYRGEFNLKFASEDFRDFFSARYQHFADNWCQIVADAPHERLEITGVRLAGNESGDASLFDDWRRTDSDVNSDMAFLDAIVGKRAYAMVWGDEDDNPIVTWEHPTQAIVGYDPETRRRIAGAKVWRDETMQYATLYLPDEVWKFSRPAVSPVLVDPLNTVENGPRLLGGWNLRGPLPVIPNPLGQVPLVEFPNRPRLLGEPHSDIAGALSWQHAINLLWAETFAVADEATLKQRGIIGAEQPVTPILDADGNVIGEKPVELKKLRRDRTLWIEDPDAKSFEWDSANPKSLTDIVEIGVGHIAAQTRTPAHYLMIGGTIANLSADAMKALETGLVKRTQEKTVHFGRAARDVFELIALVRNDPGKAEACRGGVVLWKDVENRSDAQTSDAALKDSQIGLPLQYILEKRFGLSPAEIERVVEMVRSEQMDPLTTALIDAGAKSTIADVHPTVTAADPALGA